MKLFVKFLIFVLVLGLAGPFIMKGPDGRPMMTVDDLVPNIESLKWKARNIWSKLVREAKQVASDASDMVAGETANGEPSGKTRVYKWRDRSGAWQYSDHPNPEGNSETLLVDPNTNLVQATPLPEPEMEENESEVTDQEGTVGLPLPMTIPADQVSKLIEDAKGVKDLMEKRNQALDAISGGQSEER